MFPVRYGSTRGIDRKQLRPRISSQKTSTDLSNCPTSRDRYATPQRSNNSYRQHTQSKLKALRYPSQKRKPSAIPRQNTQSQDNKDKQIRQHSQPKRRINRKKKILKGINKDIMIFVRDMLQTMMVQLKFRRSLKEMSLCFLNIDKTQNDILLAQFDPLNIRWSLLLQKITMYLIYYLSRQCPQPSKQLQQDLQQSIFCLIKIQQKLIQIMRDQSLQKAIAAISSYNNYTQMSIRQLMRRLPGMISQPVFIQSQRLLKQCREKDQSFSEAIKSIQQSFNWQILRIPKIPFLPPSQKDCICLALDLDQTLAHLKQQTGNFLVRPYAKQFLNRLGPHFQLILFTAATKQYADQIINQIDSNNSIQHRLYRYHVTNNNGKFYKDLSKIGRPLSKTILIDNLSSNFCMQPQNGIEITSWHGGADNQLQKLCQYLLTIKDVKDVRMLLPKLGPNFEPC